MPICRAIPNRFSSFFSPPPSAETWLLRTILAPIDFHDMNVVSSRSKRRQGQQYIPIFELPAANVSFSLFAARAGEKSAGPVHIAARLGVVIRNRSLWTTRLPLQLYQITTPQILFQKWKDPKMIYSEPDWRWFIWDSNKLTLHIA